MAGMADPKKKKQSHSGLLLVIGLSAPII